MNLYLPRYKYLRGDTPFHERRNHMVAGGQFMENTKTGLKNRFANAKRLVGPPYDRGFWNRIRDGVDGMQTNNTNLKHRIGIGGR